MENASKALIIAGAILIAILLVSIGIIVMNSINSTVSQAEDETDFMSVQMYNTRIAQYEGKRSAKEVRELIDLVIAKNASHTDNNIEMHMKDPAQNIYWHSFLHNQYYKIKNYLIDDEIYEVVLDGNISDNKKGGFYKSVCIIGKFEQF